ARSDGPAPADGHTLPAATRALLRSARVSTRAAYRERGCTRKRWRGRRQRRPGAPGPQLRHGGPRYRRWRRAALGPGAAQPAPPPPPRGAAVGSALQSLATMTSEALTTA